MALGTAVLLPLALAVDHFEADATARDLSAYPEAVCLDGTPGRYYFRPGQGSGATKFLVFHEGGGFCTSDADCAKRAGGQYGSTKADAPTKALLHPFFATSAEKNPLMWDWNHVLVRYCDGAYFSGERAEPLVYENQTLFYHGRWITEAVISDLAGLGLGGATDVVVSGCSAGAIRVFAHLDALRGLLPAGARVTGLPDSGFYLDTPIFTPVKRFVVEGQRATGLLSPACKAAHAGEEEKCLVGDVVAPYLATPLFAWQSRYDLDQRTCEMNRTCALSGDCVRAYGDQLTARLHECLLGNPVAGAFLDSCARHCNSVLAAPHDDDGGLTPLQAFAAWYAAPAARRSYGQNATYPCHGCCGL